MRGKKRTKEERYELFSVLEGYLEMGEGTVARDLAFILLNVALDVHRKN